MPPLSAADLIEVLRKNRVLEPEQIEELAGGGGKGIADARSLARELIGRSWLTPYQVNQMFLDQGQELVLGQYVLLERLGEGGMGQVFKARHRSLGRIVALKLIRKERLTKPDVVMRFLREVQAAAQLKHPNVVLAFDADQIGNTHFIAMEYVDGIDLSRLVKTSGPLAVELASELICQAALGLQHAHDRGMVHRDIKPANLFVTRLPPPGSKPPPKPPGKPAGFLGGLGGLGDQSGSISGTSRGPQVKILDMGLARLNPAMEAEFTTHVTKLGVVVGTVDFLAPEQAMNASNVDIRADLYSLGCTFYYLLAGRVPFAGSSAMEKLLKHRCDEPPPLEQIRPEVAPALAAVVRKLMAKRAEDRYQTPADVAMALSALAASGELVRDVPAPAAIPRAILLSPGADEGAVPMAIPLAQGTVAEPGPAQPAALPIPASAQIQESAGPLNFGAAPAAGSPDEAPSNRHSRSRSRLKPILIMLAVSILAGAIALGLILLFQPPKTEGDGTPRDQDARDKDKPGLKKPAEKEIVNAIGMKLVLIPAGSFVMGSPVAEEGRKPNEEAHEVTISQPFYLGMHEVTQGEFVKVMKRNPSYFNLSGLDHPMESVRWDEAVRYCRLLSDLPAEKKAGRVYRLPTEAEWEFACRAGMDTPISFGAGNDLSARQANFLARFPYGAGAKGKPRNRTAPVGSYAQNRFKLCDMHGNVWEWCADYYSIDYGKPGPATDPQGPATGKERVIRGGAWDSPGADCRCARRKGEAAETRSKTIGFRVVMTIAKKD